MSWYDTPRFLQPYQNILKIYPCRIKKLYYISLVLHLHATRNQATPPSEKNLLLGTSTKTHLQSPTPTWINLDRPIYDPSKPARPSHTMAKKDKKNKKAADNSWEDEIDTAPPAEAVKASAPVDAEPEPEVKPAPPTASADDDFMSGGLLGAIRKNAGKKKKKGKQVNDEEEEKPAPEEKVEEPTVDYEAKAPVAVTEIDDDEFGPIKKGKKGGKQQQQAKPASPAPKEPEEEDAGGADGGADGDGEVRVKSKKEKEKEKKEREKQKKKEAVCSL